MLGALKQNPRKKKHQFSVFFPEAQQWISPSCGLIKFNIVQPIYVSSIKQQKSSNHQLSVNCAFVWYRLHEHLCSPKGWRFKPSMLHWFTLTIWISERGKGGGSFEGNAFPSCSSWSNNVKAFLTDILSHCQASRGKETHIWKWWLHLVANVWRKLLGRIFQEFGLPWSKINFQIWCTGQHEYAKIWV